MDRPEIDCERLHATLPVKDVPAAVAYYTTRLGFTAGFVWGDPVSFAGVDFGAVQIFLQHDAGDGSKGNVQFVVGNADELYDFHKANDVEIEVAIADRDYGMRDYGIRDPDGNRLSFGQYIYTVGPPVEIERVDVPVRLEKRIAAVLADLAAHKRMALSECLEETILHTWERFGDGVASPHTSGQLRHIERLKEKHGIDYDCHAGYRFVEKKPGAESSGKNRAD